MKNFNSMADDYHTSQSNLAAETPANQQQQQRVSHQQHQQQQQQQQPPQQQMIVDEMSQDLQYLSREAPLDGGESTFGGYSQLGGFGSGSQAALDAAASEQHLLLRDDDDDEDYLRRNYEDQENHLKSGDRSLAGSPEIYAHNERALEQLAPDNVDIQRPMQQTGSSSGMSIGQSPVEAAPAEQAADSQQATAKQLKPFLVSFMVDARGGAMRGCRHSGVRVIIPPNSAQMPMRITCRYLRRERLVHPPPLMEGEACASKIMEVGPAGAKFLGPVLIEVPHFASLRGNEREIIILRSDSGEVWREHLFDADEQLVDQIIHSASMAANNETSGGRATPAPAADDSLDAAASKRRLTRIVTNEFPQYFAIISRIRQEVHPIGPQGSTVDSQVVPRVQAIFTEGALTKRIKIGLQPHHKGAKKDAQAQAQQDQASQQHQSLDESQLDSIVSATSHSQQQVAAEHLDRNGATSPASAASNQREDSQRPGSPQSAASGGAGRPGSSAAKRRSRFLACFGAGKGSVDPLADADESSSSLSAGGESPQRHRHAHGPDSDGETRSSSSLVNNARRLAPADPEQLVPEDYYIEKEPPLILNVEPKTYGKRLASSSAQTDSKLNVNGFLSTSARTPKKRGLLRGKRRNKTQMTIHCPGGEQRPKSPAADSSLDTVAGEPQVAGEQQQNGTGDAADAEVASIIREVVGDSKWRTCTIQTDSDSVTVNYVTIAGDSTPPAAEVATATQATSTQDDGYVSGSGDLNRQSSFGKGLFGLTSKSAAKEAKSKVKSESKRARKQRAKQKAKEERKQQELESAAAAAAAAASAEAKATSESPDPAKSLSEAEAHVDSIELRRVSVEHIETSESKSHVEDTKQPIVAASDGEEQQTEAVARSASPSGKELKQRQKLERQEKAKREKEEKRLLKEQEEAAARAEKLRQKAEKEAKRAEKEAKKAEKQALKVAKLRSSSPTSESASQAQGETTSKLKSAVTTSSKPQASVKFANTLVETNSLSGDDSNRLPAQQLDSIQRVIDSTSSSYELEKQRLSQEDGKDMVNLSLAGEQQQQHAPVDSSLASEMSESLVEIQRRDGEAKHLDAAPNRDERESELIQFSADDSGEDPSKSLEVTTSAVIDSTGKQQLRPILKQQSSVASTGEEMVIGEPQNLSSVASNLVTEATAEAVAAADALKALEDKSASDSVSAATDSTKAKLKEELKRAKREAKALVEAEKKAAKEAKAEAKRAAKEAEAEAKRLAKETKAEAERQAKEAKAEAERLAKEAKAEAERVAKEAKAEAERLAKEAKAEKQRLAKEAKQKISSIEQQVVEEVAQVEQQVAQIETQPQESPESKSETEDKKHEEKKSKKKAKKTKKLDVAPAPPVVAIGERDIITDVSESTGEPTSVATSSKSSFLSRLFSRGSEAKSKPKKTKRSVAEDEQIDEDKEKVKDAASKADKPLIVSEMYPSDPNNADGEMILEVNVPTNLIETRPAAGELNHQVSQASDYSQTITTHEPTSTTIDETLEGKQRDSSAAKLELQPQQVAGEDQEATLVNISQMITSDGEENDEDATENVVSQAHDLNQESPVLAKVSVEQKLDGPRKSLDLSREGDEISQVADEVVRSSVEAAVAVAAQAEASQQKGDKKQKQKKSKQDLKEEKTRKELEAKLEKESKKRAKEEEKLRKKLEKEAKVEAEKLAKEEKHRQKLEAKEAKKLAELARKQAKAEEKRHKKLAKESKKTGAEAEISALAADESLASSSHQVVKRQLTESEVAAMNEAQDAIEGLPENMQPVRSETEVERIVEEVVGEDGVVTKTTKTIETKYVTMRSEELVMAERQDMPVEEYERLQAEGGLGAGPRDDRSSSFSSSSSSSSSRSGESLTTRAKRKAHARHLKSAQTEPMVVAVEHRNEELEAIRATPSYFSGDSLPVEIAADTAPKKVMKKRIKLNTKLIKRAHKLARVEAKKAKKSRQAAEAEIAVCDEAARQAQKQLKRALKESKRANKLAAKEHKQMDKTDKKLAKNQRKIEKRQAKLDKKAAKLAKKAQKQQDKEAKKEAKRAKELEKKASKSKKKTKKQTSVSDDEISQSQQQAAAAAAGGVSTSGSRKSIRLEDIGEPILRSSSRLSIGGKGASGGSEMVTHTNATSRDEGSDAMTSQPRRRSSTSPLKEHYDDGMHVEMSLDEDIGQHPDQPMEEQVIVHHTTTTITEHPDGSRDEQTKERVLTGQEALEAAAKFEAEAEALDEEIDVVNDLPEIRRKQSDDQLQG